MRDDAVSVHYVITLDDVIDINRLLTRGLSRRLTTVIATICGIGAVAAVIVGSVPTAVALILIAVVMALSGRGQGIERWFVAGQARGIVGVPCTVSADRGGVGFQQGGVTARLEYSELTRFDQDERAFVMLGRSNTRVGVPRRAFAPAEAEVFAALVTDGMEAARRDDDAGGGPASSSGA